MVQQLCDDSRSDLIYVLFKYSEHDHEITTIYGQLYNLKVTKCRDCQIKEARP